MGAISDFLITPRIEFGVAVYDPGDGEKLYAVGGRRRSGATLRSVEVFDGEKIEYAPPMVVPRDRTCAAVLGGYLYAVAGMCEQGNNQGNDDDGVSGGQQNPLGACSGAGGWWGGKTESGSLKSVERFDGEKWEIPKDEAGNPMAIRYARQEHACATFGGKLYVVGGANWYPIPDVETFDGSSWDLAPKLPGGGRRDAAVVAYAGYLYVIGGQSQWRQQSGNDGAQRCGAIGRCQADSTFLCCPNGLEGQNPLDANSGGGKIPIGCEDCLGVLFGSTAWEDCSDCYEDHPRGPAVQTLADGPWATALGGGAHPYSTFGKGYGPGTNSVERFDGTEWSDGAPLALKRAELAAAVYKNELYVFGGNEQGGPRKEKLFEKLIAIEAEPPYGVAEEPPCVPWCESREEGWKAKCSWVHSCSGCEACTCEACRGCTDEAATNYDENANADDGSCEMPPPTFTRFGEGFCSWRELDPPWEAGEDLNGGRPSPRNDPRNSPCPPEERPCPAEDGYWWPDYTPPDCASQLVAPENGSSELNDQVDPAEGKTCGERCGAIPGCIGYSIVNDGTSCYLHVWAADANENLEASGGNWICGSPGDHGGQDYSPPLEINSVYVDTFGKQVCYTKTK